MSGEDAKTTLKMSGEDVKTTLKIGGKDARTTLEMGADFTFSMLLFLSLLSLSSSKKTFNLPLINVQT
jgi:hypothetical protein